MTSSFFKAVSVALCQTGWQYSIRDLTFVLYRVAIPSASSMLLGFTKNTKTTTSNFSNTFNMGVPVKILSDVYSNQLDGISLLEGFKTKANIRSIDGTFSTNMK